MRDHASLLRVIDGDRGLSSLRARVADRLDDDPGHDLSHALRVALWTLRIADGSVDPREGIAAALLHDAVNLPKDSPDRARASERSAELARRWLPEHGFDAPAIDRIADAIRDHSYSRGSVPETLLGCALQDADRLEALGALGIFRTVSCGTRMGARYFDPDDPWAQHRELDDIRHTVDHFFCKLLHLGRTMRTEAGRREAERRTAFMRDFLRQLGEELGEPAPGPGSEQPSGQHEKMA